MRITFRYALRKTPKIVDNRDLLFTSEFIRFILFFDAII